MISEDNKRDQMQCEKDTCRGIGNAQNTSNANW
jgi:hypothetical protein